MSLTAFIEDVDEDGIGLLAGPIAGLLSRDGQVRLVVPSDRAATTAAAGLGGAARGLTIDVTGQAAAGNAYVLVNNDGTHRAYLGTAPLTLPGLTSSRAGVVLDMRQDDAAARALLRSLSEAADDALAATAGATSLEDLMQPLVDQLESREGRGAQPPPGVTSTTTVPIPGLATGLGDLDALTGGLMPGDLWVITGRSGAGKSVLALGFARSAAIRQHASTGYVRGRGSAEDVTIVLLGAEARVPLHRLRLGGLQDDDWARLARRMGEVAEAPLLLAAGPADGDALPTARQQIASGRELSSHHDLRLLLVDDLPATVTVEELLKLKAIAERTNACVVAIVGEGVQGSLAQGEQVARLAADVLVHVDRDHDMTPGIDSPRAGEADLLVLRHRRGPISAIPVAFQGHYARFADSLPSVVPGPLGPLT